MSLLEVRMILPDLVDENLFGQSRAMCELNKLVDNVLDVSLSLCFLEFQN